MSSTFSELRAQRIAAVALLVFVGLAPARTLAGEHPATTARATAVVAGPAVSDTMRALAKLQTFGYQWTTAAGADRAIRHWQAANHLEVDGIVGPKTLASLNLLASSVAVGMKAPAPAVVRQTPQPVPAAGDVESIIRDVWPADLADKAVAIATRESRLVPTAHNSCCSGLFQIYFTVLRSHLADWGITSPTQLLDARTNAEAAYALYQLDGWQPWAL